jgi:Fe-S cluster assembly ATPase SufC
MNARRSGLVRDPEFDPSDPVRGGMTMGEFRKLVKEKLTQLKMDEAFMTRYVNDGFSGGEKKRLEMLQMALLKPEMAILDETDSGLDLEAAVRARACARTNRDLWWSGVGAPT